MKSTVLLLMIFCANVGAQSDVQFIKIKNPDGTVSLSAINHTDTKYEVLVKIEMQNMQFDQELPLLLQVPPRSTTKIGEISQLNKSPGKYIISYKANPLEILEYQIEPNITIYTKNRNKRSTQLLIYLNQNGIGYNELNTSYSSDTKALYGQMLNRRSIDAKNVKLPVVVYHGEVFYNIKDINKFCKTYFEGEGHFIKKQDRKY